jgi:flagellar hook-associated protein 2
MSLNSVNRNILRISGLNSGLDTDSIVQSMMTNTLNKVNKQFRSQRLLEWKQEKYKEINNELRKYKDEFSTVTKQAQNMLSEYNYKAFSVKFNNENDSAYVGVTASPDAREGTVTIDYVKQLATSAYVTSKDVATTDGNGVKLSDNLMTVASKLQRGNQMVFSKDAATGSSQVSFTLDGQNFTFSAQESLSSVLNQINARTENVRINYTQLTDKFTLESKATGTGIEANVRFTDSHFLNALGIANSADFSEGARGQDAIFSINGTEATRSSNSFEIDGVNYTLKKAFGGEWTVPDPTKPDEKVWTQTDKDVVLNLSRDLDTTVEAIAKYIEGYNTIVRNLNNLLSETVDRDYYPLTEEEEEELTEKQLEKWDGLAKQGMLRNDSQLRGLLTDMRMSFYNKVGGNSLMLSDIGVGGGTLIGSTAYEDAKIGIINIDETKLREALTTSPDQVFQLFTNKDASGDIDSMGLVTRVNTLIDRYVKNNEQTTQTYNQTAIDQAQYRYDEMLQDMYDEEDRLWARFTALEETMASLNSQQDWIGSQLGL